MNSYSLNYLRSGIRTLRLVFCDSKCASLRTMERARLEDMTIEELQAEANRYRIQVPLERNEIVDAIMSHLERNGPYREMLGPLLSGAMRTFASNDSNVQVHEVQSPIGGMAIRNAGEDNRLDVLLPQFCATFSAQMQQQQQLIQQLLTAVRDNAVQNSQTNEREANRLTSEERVVAREETINSAAINGRSSSRSTIGSASPAQAVNLLAPQIPEFGGSDDEDVELWVQ